MLATSEERKNGGRGDFFFNRKRQAFGLILANDQENKKGEGLEKKRAYIYIYI